MSDMDLFVGVSAALTGISQEQLAPSLNPSNVPQQYFNLAKTDPNFQKLLQTFNDLNNKKLPPDQIAKAIMADPTLAPLARAIILEWYTGGWYKPADLVKPPPDPTQQASAVKVISSDAYTQGWMWNVAQAHPMGYSNWHFGYWSSPPPSLDDFTTGGQQ